MRKKWVVFLSCLLLAQWPLASITWAAGTAGQRVELVDVLPSDDILPPGGVLTVQYTASHDGVVHVHLFHAEQAPEGVAYASFPARAGSNTFDWDGTIEGGLAAPGPWQVSLRLVSEDSGESIPHLVMVEVPGEAAGNGMEAVGSSEVQAQEEQPAEYTPITRYPDPAADNYWQMDIHHFDIQDPATQERLWRYMRQPVTVVDVGPNDHWYPVREPGASRQEATNITGQLHGTTQAVHIIEERDGWTLIEAFSNDGNRAPFKRIADYAGQLIEGWVPSDKLITVEPNQTIGLVIDKLHQRMYIFENGVITGELLISTGKPTKDSPNVETPAGEFLIDSWVGLFDSYGLQCDLALRINGGVLIHEVPHLVNADGTRNYGKFEPHLGQKASHGCVRTQRAKNKNGQNMTWLWKNMKRGAKVIIIDDLGRTLLPPDPDTTLYYNPNRGKNYHADPNCHGVDDRFLPLSGVITYQDLFGDFAYLTPCSYCAPPQRIGE